MNVRPAVQAVATTSQGKDSSELLYMGSSTHCFQEQDMLDEATISDNYGVNQPNSQSKISSPD